MGVFSKKKRGGEDSMVFFMMLKQVSELCERSKREASVNHRFFYKKQACAFKSWTNICSVEENEKKNRKLWMGTGFRKSKSKTKKKAFVILLNFRALSSPAVCH